MKSDPRSGAIGRWLRSAAAAIVLLIVAFTMLPSCGSDGTRQVDAKGETERLSKLPARPEPPQLVNDLAGVLGDTEAMEDTLVALARGTGNQIVVVTTDDLLDLEPWDYALQLGRAWGVGQKDKNNGVVVLVKPKTKNSRGQAYISVGYGLEGAIPDAVATQIVNSEMIPRFKENDYNAGVSAAIDVLVPLARGEYGYDAYMSRVSDAEDEDFLVDLLIVIITITVIILIILLSAYADSGDDSDHGSATWGGPTIWGGGASSWGSSSSSWGRHSSSSSWGGGGFGGFGGGSFGGGGGGGSW